MPRFNPRKFRKNLINGDVYKAWKDKTGRTESFEQFKAVWLRMALKIREKILTEPDGIRITGLGDIYIGIVPKAKKRAVDYKTSRELGKIVYFENWNTSGKIGKIIYATKDRPYIYTKKRFWGFKPHTTFKMDASVALQNNPERYKNSIERKYYENS